MNPNPGKGDLNPNEERNGTISSQRLHFWPSAPVQKSSLGDESTVAFPLPLNWVLKAVANHSEPVQSRGRRISI
jgi:hypothetical protein